mmetsp:Transcript_28911/g.76928  ORF Transcript_28911/g.76928 Transcript_28911/m.76928 type:complete len:480 (+) Transcript_28911:189-1628(+)
MAEKTDAFDPSMMQQMQQMQQMQAMLGAMGGMGGMPALPSQPAPDMTGFPGMAPQVDPAMAAAYMAMAAQYLQQGLTQPAAPQMPSVAPPLPGMPSAGYGAGYGAGGSPPEPAVNVTVEGMKFQYQLTEDDLHKVFSRYGTVKDIKVDEAGASSVITFHTFQDAQAAMTDLNGKVLNGLEGTLRLTWVNSQSLPPPYPQVPFPGWGFPSAASSLPGLPAAWPPSSSMGGGDAPGGGMDREKLPPHNKGVRKYTCRFIIGIENDKEFQVARKIIGSKGTHMKKIVRNTEAKLRLRGQGSGYFEGASKTESPEPLQLCISCVSFDGYKTAVKQTEALLKSVYDEYRQFCKDTGRPVPENLQISLSENQLVYSSKEDLSGAGDDDAGSPDKKDPRRGRRSRAKRDTKTASGEVDRGEPGPNAPPIEDIEKLIDERNEARRGTNWGEADRIRQLLHSKGVALMDEPGGRGRGTEVTTWRYWRD